MEEAWLVATHRPWKAGLEDDWRNVGLEVVDDPTKADIEPGCKLFACFPVDFDQCGSTSGDAERAVDILRRLQVDDFRMEEALKVMLEQAFLAGARAERDGKIKFALDEIGGIASTEDDE